MAQLPATYYHCLSWQEFFKIVFSLYKYEVYDWKNILLWQIFPPSRISKHYMCIALRNTLLLSLFWSPPTPKKVLGLKLARCSTTWISHSVTLSVIWCLQLAYSWFILVLWLYDQNNELKDAKNLQRHLSWVLNICDFCVTAPFTLQSFDSILISKIF